MVYEYGIKIFIKESFGYLTFKFVEPKIKKLKAWQMKNNVRKLPCKAIIAEIQLEKMLQFLETPRDLATEPVGVNVKQCNIYEES